MSYTIRSLKGKPSDPRPQTNRPPPLPFRPIHAVLPTASAGVWRQGERWASFIARFLTTGGLLQLLVGDTQSMSD